MKQRFFLKLLAIATISFMVVTANLFVVSAATTQVSNEVQLRAALVNAGRTPTTIELAANILLESNLIIPANADITLTSTSGAEFSLIANRNMPTITVERNAGLTINNISVTRADGTRGSGIVNNGALIINNGTISGHRAAGTLGPAPANALGRGVESSGTVIMNGGTISNNQGGIHSTGILTMYEGAITNNNYAQGGGGVSFSGEFTIHGGIISNNSAGRGGGVISSGEFTMYGGIITNNTTAQGGDRSGGGVYNSSFAHFIMHGGTITNNSIHGFGGGVHNSGRFTMYDGIISDNIALPFVATAARTYGGGVSNMGEFILHGGIITNNTAREGGGLANFGTFTIEGGWIFDNTVTHAYADFLSFGRSIFHNNIFDPSNGAIGNGPPSNIAAAPPIPQSGTIATPTASAVLINNQPVSFGAYNIDGANYFRLRDIAYALNGTSAQFNVSWSEAQNAIGLAPGFPYIPVGGEMAPSSAVSTTATPTNSAILLDTNTINLTAYNIGGSNFFMLRELGDLLGFDVDWDAATNTILITTP